MADRGGSRLARWTGLAGLAVRRTVGRATRGEGRQTVWSVLGVAVAVALLLLVTGVGLGFTSGEPTAGTDADYWVVPAGSAGSAITDVGGGSLGQVHAAAARMNAIDGVTHATPVLSTLLRVPVGEESEHVLAVGVIPGNGTDTRVMGVSAAGLAPGDPYYANGGYDGPRTGEAVLSPGAAELLDRSAGDRFELRGGAAGANATFRVVGTARSGARGQLPLAVVHLSELQVLTGAAEGDVAERVLVTAEPGARGEIAAVYPRTDVLSRTQLLGQRAARSESTVATAVAALVVALVVGVLSVVTTLGFEVMSDAHNLAVMAAVGVSGRSRLALIGVQTLTVAAAGGAAGVVLGAGGLAALNLASTAYYGVPVARFHPYLVPYGLGVALLIGVLAVPYLLVVGRRLDVYQRLGVR